MDAIERFCSQLLNDGRVVFAERPVTHAGASDGAKAYLSRAFHADRMSLAGPPIAFDAEVALEAAELVRQACWAVVCHDEPAETLGSRLTMRRPPGTPAAHLSADLTLRYLPGVLRRARAAAPSDPLVALLTVALRRWPLSGVLSEVSEPPLTPLDFGGHEGLLMLYAERLFAHTKPGWVPGERAGEFAALVFQEAGRTLPDAQSEPGRNG